MQRQNYQIIRSTAYFNQKYQPTETTLDRNNFDVSFLFYPSNQPTYDLQTYFQYLSVNISQVNYFITSDGYMENVIQIPIEICTADRFGNQSEALQDLGITNNGHCAEKNFNIQVKGSFAANEGSLLRFTIQKCNQQQLDRLYPDQGMKCKSNKEIEKIIPILNMDTTFLKQYFEETNFDTPIKSILYNQQHTLQNDKFTYKTYYFTKNYVELEDSYLSQVIYNQNLTYNKFSLESVSQREI
eukprot:403376625